MDVTEGMVLVGISHQLAPVELREREVERQDTKAEAPVMEFYYWDFPELSSRKN